MIVQIEKNWELKGEEEFDWGGEGDWEFEVEGRRRELKVRKVNMDDIDCSYDTVGENQHKGSPNVLKTYLGKSE